MSTTPHAAPTPTASTTEHTDHAEHSEHAANPPDLGTLADALEALALETELPTLALGVLGSGDDLDLALRPLGTHPLSELLGFEAPPEWSAFGLVAQGQAHPIADDEECTAELEPAVAPDTPVGVVHLVRRDGTCHNRVVGPGGARLIATDQPQGMLVDLGQRILGAPTAAPTVSPAHYVAQRWLSTLLLDAADERLPPTWSLDHAIPGAGSGLAGVVDADPVDWEVLRQRWMACPDGHAGLTPAELDWMDAGMLSRWCCGQYPDLADLHDAGASILPASLLGAVTDRLARWGLATDLHSSG